MAVGLFGETGIVQHQADPAQKVHAGELARFTDLLHARIGGIVGFGQRHILSPHLLASGSNPLAERHGRDAVLDGVDVPDLFLRIVGESDACQHPGKVGLGLHDVGPDEPVGQLAAPVRADQQPPNGAGRIELAADHVPPARVVIVKLDTPIMILDFGDDDDRGFL